jgi:hypothetical protein
MIAAEEFLRQLVSVSQAVGMQAGVGETETAGLFVSCLAARPELIPRFMEVGAGLMVDGEIRAELGCMDWRAANGKIVTPEALRDHLEARELLRLQWNSFCDADPVPEGFVERMHAEGFCHLRGVTADDLEMSFAADRGIKRGGSIWVLTDEGREAMKFVRSKTPQPTAE